MRSRKRKTIWLRAVPDRSGAYDYLVLVRDSLRDPQRRLRGSEAGDVAPHRALKKTRPEEWAEKIVALLEDGKPRTFNAIAVELLDKTADVVGGTPVEKGLWLLVERGVLEYTPKAPIYFRRIRA